MSLDTDEQLKVTFPASPDFTRIGRVAISGLAMRLGIELSSMNELQTVVDTAVKSLQGEGQITVQANWSEDYVYINFQNNDQEIDAETKSDLESLNLKGVDSIKIVGSKITIQMSNT